MALAVPGIGSVKGNPHYSGRVAERVPEKGPYRLALASTFGSNFITKWAA